MQFEPITLFYVEPNIVDAQELESVLSEAGLEVACARISSPSEFMEVIGPATARRPGVIIAGWNSGPVAGHEVAEAIATLTHEIPLVLVASDQSTNEDRADAGLLSEALAVIQRNRLPQLPAAILRAHHLHRERQLVERARLDLLRLVITRVLTDATEIEDAMSGILRSVCTSLRWTAGLYWRPDEQSKTLRCAAVWHAEEIEPSAFIEGRELLALHQGEGAPGRVWASGVPLAISPRNDDVRRDASDGQTVLWSGVAFPVVEGSEVQGVFEFYDSGFVNWVDPEFLAALGEAGSRIGEFCSRRRSEEKLRASEAMLANAQRLAHLGSFSFDVESQVIEWSDETYRIFGLTPEGPPPTVESYLARIHLDDRDEVARLAFPPYKHAFTCFEHRVLRDDRTVRTVECHLHIAEGTLDSPSSVIGTIQDITKRLEAQETIERLGRQTELILNSAAEGIFGIDVAGKLIFMNEAASRMTGFTRTELMALPSVHEALHAKYPDGRDYPLDQCPTYLTMTDGETRVVDEVYWKKDGTPLPVEYSVSPIQEGGEITGCVLTFQDLSARQKLERQLSQAHRVNGLGRVAATIAHEFNNVLMGIQPFAEVIRRRTTGDEKVQQAAGQIVSSVARGKRVTQEILRFTQPSEPALKPVVFYPWLESILPELQGLIGQRIKIVLENSPGTVVIRCDVEQMQQVFTNLVLNARDAIEWAGTIRIAVHGTPDQESWPFGEAGSERVVVTIEDTGKGISPETLGSIFEPLFTTKRSGTGLGLALVEQIVAAHHGSVHVQSVEGEGTTFFLALQGEVSEAVATT